MEAETTYGLRTRILELEDIHAYIVTNRLIFLRVDYIIEEIRRLKIALADAEAEARFETQRLITQN